jgi:hypothetical protein
MRNLRSILSGKNEDAAEQTPAPRYVPLPPGTVRDPEAMEDTAAGPDEGDEQYW